MFFKVTSSEEVFQILEGFEPLGEETVPLEKASGRILSQDIISAEDLPGFYRSSMDGYAVRAKDTFGASESLPALLEVAGDSEEENLESIRLFGEAVLPKLKPGA